MTLVVFQEAGQQPSTSGHQCRTGGNRMASAGQSSKPEMYSRAVQTGFPHPSDNANLHHPHQQLPICICGQAGEGNCWCESLGFLKDQELCRVVLQKGCPRSRFAVLLSMHEEFCKSARGDQIINTRRRGSAHGDIRVKRSKLAPPPTLPRPRAQSVIIQKTRAANRLNEANTKRSPQVSVKPKVSDPTRQGQQKQDGKGKCSARVLPKKDQQIKNEKKCLENNALSNGTALKKENSVAEEGSHLDQTSYVSKAWLLFTGCETGKKTKDSEGSKPEAMCNDHYNKESMKGSSSSVSDTKRLNNQAAHLEGSSQSDRKKDAEKVNRITGLSVSSKRKVTNKSESTSMSTESSNKYANRLKGRKSDSESQTSNIAQRVGKPDFSDECDRTALLDSVTITCDDEAETGVSGACRLDPQDSIREGELSMFVSSTLGDPLMNRNVKDLDQSSDLAGSDLNERLKDNWKLDGSLAIPVKRCDHVSYRDSGIGSSGSVCESRLSATHSVMVEDKSESEDGMTRAETKNCHKPDSLSAAFGPSRAFKEGEGNIPFEETNNSRMSHSSLLQTAQGSPCSESTPQVQDDYLLGACAIVEKDHSVCNDYNSSSEGDGINTTSSKDKAVQGNCQSPAAKEEEFSFISSVIVIEDKQSQSTSEQCLSISDSKSCKDEGSRPVDAEHSHMVQLHINVDLKVKHDDLNKLKKDNVNVKKRDRIVHPKVSKKSENERTKERKHQRTMNPNKVGILKYLICQSPLILSDLNDSDYEDSESELEDSSYNKEDQFATMPVEIVLKIFRELRTRDLSQLKFTCKNFYWLIMRFNIIGVDSKWVEIDSYRNDPCMQCGKVRDRRGDVSLCYWHPKYYYRTGNGRHHWTCCLNTSKDAPGCCEGLHDNKWTTSKVMKRSIPRQWSSNMWHLCPHKVNMDP